MRKNSLSRFPGAFAGVVAALVLLNGCRDSGGHGHPHGDGHGHSHDHHDPPHGGTPVLIAADKFHLELVLDAHAGKMQAYVLDGHLESYIEVAETGFVLVAKTGGLTEQLNFQRAPAPGSSAVPQASSLFEAHADWLKTAKQFEGGIPTITLNGTTFSNISFPFPKGTKHVH